MLNELNPVLFNFKGEHRRNIGFIAEESPDCICVDDKKAISLMDIIAILTGALKAQRDLIKKLNDKIHKMMEDFKDGDGSQSNT